jgi:hypothetical protein
MFFIKPYIFNQFHELIVCITTKIGLNRKAPYYLNFSHSVGDDEGIVSENRRILFSTLGIENFKIHFQRQIHSDIVRIVDSNSVEKESDALICSDRKNALNVIVADCVPILIYDSKNKIISAVHSGWCGTHKKILKKTLHLLKNNFGSNSKDLFVYLGPSISQKNYEVGEEVANLFDKRYILINQNKFYLDISSANYDIAIEFGISKNQIQKSSLCTYEMKTLFHSYRRDGKKSGRFLGVIALK